MGQLTPESIRAIAVCTVFFLAIIGSIVVALLDHQRKMADLIRKDRQNTDGLNERVDALQNDIRELKSMLAPTNQANDIEQRIRS